MSDRRLESSWWGWGPVWAHMTAIFISSSLPGSAVPSALPDKPVHFAVYGLLGALVLRALARGRWFGVGGRTALASIVLTITYGVSDEWHQSFVPGRSPDSMDLLVNGVGATVVVGAAWVWSIIKTSRAHATRRSGHAAPTFTE
ncbi:MAG: VanZ family protein [Acidobacteriota bacterium]|nr:VanZ family protein [Acidobacteriota bacterium]MEE3138396.1 VanZ family protein [Acidobacteriota bacterium]